MSILQKGWRAAELPRGQLFSHLCHCLQATNSAVFSSQLKHSWPILEVHYLHLGSIYLPILLLSTTLSLSLVFSVLLQMFLIMNSLIRNYHPEEILWGKLWLKNLNVLDKSNSCRTVFATQSKEANWKIYLQSLGPLSSYKCPISFFIFAKLTSHSNKLHIVWGVCLLP